MVAIICSLSKSWNCPFPAEAKQYKGKPIRQVSTKAWYAALKRAGIENFRWHDLRHTWASWHVQAGTPLHILKELGGWETEEMVARYAHLGASHLKQYTSQVEGIEDTTKSQGHLRLVG
ncbi:MAG: tyrosine-type recombinase/integrase [Magnetococcales bacterium]|nr:tyrosine-type recombinase/integrase [Magnetococcales bacterium]